MIVCIYPQEEDIGDMAKAHVVEFTNIKRISRQTIRDESRYIYGRLHGAIRHPQKGAIAIWPGHRKSLDLDEAYIVDHPIDADVIEKAILFVRGDKKGKTNT